MLKNIQPILMRTISEKTIEINILRHLANCIENRSPGSNVGVIAPTQNQEKNLGFDAILGSTKDQQVIAIQFKRPKMNTHSKHVKFKIDVEQQNVFTRYRSSILHKFYILSPFVSHNEFIKKTGEQLLRESSAIHVCDMPNTRNIQTKSYTLTLKPQHNLFHKKRSITRNSLNYLCDLMLNKDHYDMKKYSGNDDELGSKIKEQKISRTYYVVINYNKTSN